MALAVSGGSDSTALMVLASEMGQRDKLTVLSVNHGLRDDAHKEIASVCKLAEKFELNVAGLNWQHEGVESRLQEKARVARYDLMTNWCLENDVGILVTGHTLDDQAETVLMRLARGSGVDGLAAMAEKTEWNGVEIVRPLLGVSRASLRAFLQSKDIGWIDDPSNENEKFERIRVRNIITDLEAIGISRQDLARSARRLGRAKLALDRLADDFLERYVEVFDTGYCQISSAGLNAASPETAVRVIARLLEWAGGGDIAVRMAKIEPLVEKLVAGQRGKHDRFTLGGAHIVMRKDRILIGREFGRINPGWQKNSNVWDRRFIIETQGKVISVAPYGTVIDDDDRLRPEDLPYFVACGLPMLEFEDGTICVPHLDRAKGEAIGVVNLVNLPKGMK